LRRAWLADVSEFARIDLTSMIDAKMRGGDSTVREGNTAGLAFNWPL
jgi:hypothetical protein